ncbi:hypothetical protein EYZ11_006890 [Aspergillus tanneri]|uniref:Peptidase M20 dimerisation domain-containing protein n=1 Tax=Aspergillus tanneri TaxID=1220188 RepID=A0A4S3JEP2_9EURO|nr:uncharacterized protein ATNIH1004_008743 [Aspergillus tanneri]KAA8644539.1 hypothetical protein ATNIH1004_008743 [Aspergillus tanneri]THC93640.1 hypothetical protein EYZ11_006890 [Aspergillus tanneri]
MQVNASNHGFKAIIDQFRPDLQKFEQLYRQIHACPELSGQEEETSKIAADFLQGYGFEVYTYIGGYGVAGVLRNGSGPTVLLRADMDALPVQEKTGLPYTSQKTVRNNEGEEIPVMHACGHDIHVVALMGSAQLLHEARQRWSGTLICIFQPAEETVSGAQAMVDDGLYEKVPKPDVVLAQHLMRAREGTVSLRSGRLFTAGDSFDVRIYGRGGHGSAPQACINPIVIGASIVTRLQTVVSCEVAPEEFAVVSCGSIQSGHKANIIPDQLDLKLNIRTYNAETRERVISAIKRIIEAECEAGGAIEKPLIQCNQSVPATINDDATAKTLQATFGSYFKDNLIDAGPLSASEDFTILATAVGAPYVMWLFGGVDSKTWDDAMAKGTVDELPYNHSPFFAPTIEPTVQTAVDAMSIGALTFLRQRV